MTSKADEREAGRRAHGEGEEPTPHADQLEDYAGGYIQARHGRIAPWLLAVYAVLFVWAMYYLYVYWGGLGPGLAL
jgi:hypothetical protein